MSLSEQDFTRAAERLDCDIPTIKAVAEVESSGSGFLPTGEPVILFERHFFHRLTAGEYDGRRVPEMSDKYSIISSRTPGGYGPRAVQHTKLQYASRLHREAALMSCSWGLFQIMGANYKRTGHNTLQSFVNAMYRSESDHLDAFVEFIISEGLVEALRLHNWTAFARKYNGPGYSKNRYDSKLAAAWRRYSAEVVI